MNHRKHKASLDPDTGEIVIRVQPETAFALAIAGWDDANGLTGTATPIPSVLISGIVEQANKAFGDDEPTHIDTLIAACGVDAIDECPGIVDYQDHDPAVQDILEIGVDRTEFRIVNRALEVRFAPCEMEDGAIDRTPVVRHLTPGNSDIVSRIAALKIPESSLDDVVAHYVGWMRLEDPVTRVLARICDARIIRGGWTIDRKAMAKVIEASWRADRAAIVGEVAA